MRAGVSGFVPVRLTQARVSAGLTKLDLGNRIGKSPSSVTRWEKGESLPESEALESLSLILKCPIAWFTKELPPETKSNIFFRTLATTTNDLRTVARVKIGWQQEIATYFSKWLDWPEIKLPQSNAIDHRELDRSDVANYAQSCRDMWGLGLGPIENLLLSIESAGVICSKIYQGHTKMDGLSQWEEPTNRPFILLSKDKNNYYRGRFDAAHELGHLVMHRFINTFDLLHHKEIEDQANYFASCFLLPEESLSLELPRYPSLENLLGLKRRWKVSVAAIIFRANKLGLIGEDETLRLRKSYSARGWSKGEPLDDSTPPETIRLLPRAVKALLDNNIKSKSQIVSELLLARREIEHICGLEPDFLTELPTLDNNACPALRKPIDTTSNVVAFKQRDRQ